MDTTYNNNHILDFGCSTQQQETITFHSESKFLNPKPLIYLFFGFGSLKLNLFCFNVSSLLCVGASCNLSICLMAEVAYFCMIESVGRVDENALAPHTQTPIGTSSFLDVENVNLQIGSITFI